MGESSIQNPHDGFFKQTFGRVDFAREFLAKFLSAEVAEYLDLAALQAASESFVDDDLRQTQSDLVYRVPLIGGGEAVVYLLFEHKSYPDRLTVFQLLKYVVRINERRLRDGLPLCCVIPLVVYHGPSGWNVARSLDQLIEVPVPLARFLPVFRIELVDLSSYDDEQLRSGAFLHATLLMLKYVLRPELPGQLERILGLLAALPHQAHGLDCVKLLLAYVIQGSDRVDAEGLRAALRAGLPERVNELMPTLAEQWVKQGKEAGRQEGRQEGMLIGRIQACRSMLGESTDGDDLSGKSVAELQELAERLQAQVRQRLAGGRE